MLISCGPISSVPISSRLVRTTGGGSTGAGLPYWWLDELRRQQERDWARLQRARELEIAARQAAAQLAFEKALAHQRKVQQHAVAAVLLSEL